MVNTYEFQTALGYPCRIQVENPDSSQVAYEIKLPTSDGWRVILWGQATPQAGGWGWHIKYIHGCMDEFERESGTLIKEEFEEFFRALRKAAFPSTPDPSHPYWKPAPTLTLVSSEEE